MHNALLTFSFSNAKEKGIPAVERHWITENYRELNQLAYFKDLLTSKWKPSHELHWGQGFVFVSTGEEKV